METSLAPFQALPVPDADSAPFWEGCRRHELLLQRCAECGRLRFPPAPLCWNCRSWSYRWERHSGRGTVYSWVIVHHPIPPSIAPLIPYVVAIVELEPSVKMPTRLVDVALEDLRADLPVKVVFDDVDEHVTLPLFSALSDVEDPR
jgi:uncharacterized OB-fold protein